MFEQKKYQAVKSILSEEIVDIVSEYAMIKELTSFNSEPSTAQVPGAHSVYADSLMECLLLKLKPSIEFVSGKTLIPTYSYYRVYRPGHELKPHIDRPACEISATVSFGRNYFGKDYSWPMFVEGTPIHLEPGDAIVYKGLDASHWREQFMAPQFSYHIQGFFHYVDANGPYKDQAMDKRNYIGEPKHVQSAVGKSYITYTK